MSLVDSFLSGNLTEAKKLIDERITKLFEQKLEIIKKLMTGIEYREHEPWKSMYT
mgnify:CR=1 FL=1